MNLAGIAFTFLAYGLFVAQYNLDTTTDAPEFPTFNPISFEFQEMPESCGGFLDFLECIGNVFINLVTGIINAVLLLFEALRLIIALIDLIVFSAFTGVNGAPSWFNTLLIGGFGIMIAVIVYKAIRKGDTDSS